MTHDLPEIALSTQLQLPSTVFHAVVDASSYKSVLAYALVASWHAYCRGWSVLRIVLVGENPRLERFAEGLGVKIEHRTPHPLAKVLPFSNKWLAAEAEHPRQRSILVDTDIIFLGDPWLLRSLPSTYFAARPAPALRLTPKLQDWAIKRFDLPVGINVANGAVAMTYLKGQPLSEITADIFVRQFRYYNSGLVVFPSGEFSASLGKWNKNQEILQSHYDEAVASSSEANVNGAILNCEQLALAVTLAHHPVFQLDYSQHFLTADVVSGISDEEVSVMHLVGPVPGIDPSSPMAAVEAFDIITGRYLNNGRYIFERNSLFNVGRLRSRIIALLEEYGLSSISTH